jgi:hypothetical protein
MLAVKEPLVWVAGMLRLPGRVTLPLLLASVTEAPPAGAGPDSVTVQEELPGAFTVAGEQVKLEGTTITGAVRLTEADWVRPLSEAVRVAVWLVAIVPAVAMKVVLVCPEAIVTLAGTGKVAVLLLSETAVELEAVLFSETVQVVVALLVSVDGEQESEESWGGGAARLTVNV